MGTVPRVCLGILSHCIYCFTPAAHWGHCEAWPPLATPFWEACKLVRTHYSRFSLCGPSGAKPWRSKGRTWPKPTKIMQQTPRKWPGSHTLWRWPKQSNPPFDTESQLRDGCWRKRQAEGKVLKSKSHSKANRKLWSSAQVEWNSDVFKRRKEEMEHGQMELDSRVCHNGRTSTIVIQKWNKPSPMLRGHESTGLNKPCWARTKI